MSRGQDPQQLRSKRQVRIADDLAPLIDQAVLDGEGKSMADVVDRILRLEFRRREGLEPGPQQPRGSAGVHRPRGRL